MVQDAGLSSLDSERVLLMAVLGRSLGRLFPLSPGDTVVGDSAEADLRLPDLPERSAVIHWEDSVVTIELSTPGVPVFVNGKPVTDRTTLAPSDRIQLDEHVLQLLPAT